jgi:hypothetical protein
MLLLDITWTDGQIVGLIDAIQMPSDLSSHSHPVIIHRDAIVPAHLA